VIERNGDIAPRSGRLQGFKARPELRASGFPADGVIERNDDIAAAKRTPSGI
jgi:hypothetical protein